MSFRYFSHNGKLLPLEQAVVPLSRVEYAYGYGVYESVRVNKGRIFFLAEHCRRLMNSARVIGLEHNFQSGTVEKAVQELVRQNQAVACNIKIMLIGGRAAEAASLEILCLNPLFPDRKLYKTGGKTITYRYEREFPAAKTLNMLPSYIAFKAAVNAGAYDALLVNRQDCITEGTRSNFFGLRGRTIVSPPAEQILPGVTRAKVLAVAEKHDFQIVEQPVKQSELSQFDSLFITSTACKILPLSNVDDRIFKITSEMRELMIAFDSFLEQLAN